MGRIIPYIMENKSHVPNRQPVNKSTLYHEILWNNGTSQNQCLYSIKWDTNSMVSDVDSIPWKIVYQFLSYPRFDIQFMPINAQVGPSNPIQTLHHQSKKCQHQLLMVALTLNWYEDPVCRNVQYTGVLANSHLKWENDDDQRWGIVLLSLCYPIFRYQSQAISHDFPMIFTLIFLCFVGFWVHFNSSRDERASFWRGRFPPLPGLLDPVGKELIN